MFIRHLTVRAVPIIIVFTKIDRLEFKEQKRLKAEYISSGVDKVTATKRAKDVRIAAARSAYEKSCVSVLKSSLVPPAWTHYCAVSNKSKVVCHILELRADVCIDQDLIVNLIKLTTSTLSQSETLNIMWASAQMVSSPVQSWGLLTTLDRSPRQMLTSRLRRRCCKFSWSLFTVLCRSDLSLPGPGRIVSQKPALNGSTTDFSLPQCIGVAWAPL